MKIKVWDREGYLGCLTINRPGEPVPTNTIYVEAKPNGYLRYVTGDDSTFMLTPFDRKRSQAVMEDDTPERHAAFRQALLADRWVNVVARG